MCLDSRVTTCLSLLAGDVSEAEMITKFLAAKTQLNKS